MNLPFLFIMIAFGVLALMGMVVCFIFILRRIFVKQGKLAELTSAYPAEIQPEGMVLEKQTIGLGRSLRFRRCTRVCISEEGFYLALKVIIGKRLAFLIPWGELSNAAETHLYGLKALGFSVGSPEIISIKVYPSLFAEIKPYLER